MPPFRNVTSKVKKTTKVKVKSLALGFTTSLCYIKTFLSLEKYSFIQILQHRNSNWDTATGKVKTLWTDASNAVQ